MSLFIFVIAIGDKNAELPAGHTGIFSTVFHSFQIWRRKDSAGVPTVAGIRWG